MLGVHPVVDARLAAAGQQLYFFEPNQAERGLWCHVNFPVSEAMEVNLQVIEWRI